MNAPDLKLVEDNASPRAAGVSRFHESARAQVAGAATYIDDIPEVRGTLHAAPVCSPVAHGVLKGLHASAALTKPRTPGTASAAEASMPRSTPCATGEHTGAPCRVPRTSGMSSM